MDEHRLGGFRHILIVHEIVFQRRDNVGVERLIMVMDDANRVVEELFHFSRLDIEIEKMIDSIIFKMGDDPNVFESLHQSHGFLGFEEASMQGRECFMLAADADKKLRFFISRVNSSTSSWAKAFVSLTVTGGLFSFFPTNMMICWLR